MQKREVKPGRPIGATTFEPEVAKRLGAAIRERRLAQRISQEELAIRAAVERSHMGKVERGEHLPSLSMFVRIARALKERPGSLLDRAFE